mmetsp:Transcript_46563/g.105218  ORF Transcript_46563/g.105218 Transcript_46563/m.105218 type:complete len:387 (-) Transcript_46563:299-1459(-)
MRKLGENLVKHLPKIFGVRVWLGQLVVRPEQEDAAVVSFAVRGKSVKIDPAVLGATRVVDVSSPAGAHRCRGLRWPLFCFCSCGVVRLRVFGRGRRGRRGAREARWKRKRNCFVNPHVVVLVAGHLDLRFRNGLHGFRDGPRRSVGPDKKGRGHSERCRALFRRRALVLGRPHCGRPARGLKGGSVAAVRAERERGLRRPILGPLHFFALDAVAQCDLVRVLRLADPVQHPGETVAGQYLCEVRPVREYALVALVGPGAGRPVLPPDHGGAVPLHVVPGAKLLERLLAPRPKADEVEPRRVAEYALVVRVRGRREAVKDLDVVPPAPGQHDGRREAGRAAADNHRLFGGLGKRVAEFRGGDDRIGVFWTAWYLNLDFARNVFTKGD